MESYFARDIKKKTEKMYEIKLYKKNDNLKAMFIQSIPEHLPLSEEKSLMRLIALSRWRFASKRIELFPAH